MSIMIDKAKCKGCGMCTSVCPGSLIYQDSEKKAFIKYPKDCWAWNIKERDGSREEILINKKESNKY